MDLGLRFPERTQSGKHEAKITFELQADQTVPHWQQGSGAFLTPPCQVVAAGIMWGLCLRVELQGPSFVL